MKINSKTKNLCLFGHPVEHSFSPEIHNYLLEKYSQNIIYQCFDVFEDKLRDATQAIEALGIVGCNVTIPHKVNIIEYLDELDKKSELVGAVNTIKNIDNKLIGYNTDGIGFVKSIYDLGKSVKEKNILIIGAGGACRSIAIELALEGANSIEIRNRSIANAKSIVDTINKNTKTIASYRDKVIDKSDLEKIDIFINTTPIGMKSDKCPIDESIEVNKDILVCDIVYNPHETNLIKWSKKQGLDVMYGIDMLVNQGIEAFKIWTGIEPSIDDKKAIKDLYKDTH